MYVLGNSGGRCDPSIYVSDFSQNEDCRLVLEPLVARPADPCSKRWELTDL